MEKARDKLLPSSVGACNGVVESLKCAVLIMVDPKVLRRRVHLVSFIFQFPHLREYPRSCVVGMDGVANTTTGRRPTSSPSKRYRPNETLAFSP